MVLQGGVAASGNDFAAPHQHGAHGHLACGRGGAGLVQGQAHEMVVGVHLLLYR